MPLLPQQSNISQGAEMDPLFAPASVPRRRKQNVLLLIAAIAFVSVGIVLLKRDNTNGTTTTTTSGAGAGAGAGHTSVEQDGNDQFLPGLDQAREQQHHPQASLEFEPEETEKEYNLSKDDNQGYHAEDQVGQEEVAAETTPSSSSSSSSSEQERDPLDTAPILPDTTEQDIITETLEEEASDPNFVGVDANLLAEEENLLQEEEAMIPTEEDLDGSIMNETVVEIPELEYDRNLAEDHDDHANHMPLMCNANLSTASCAANGFSSLLGGNNDTVTVPCGQCYTMDITDGSTVELPTGLAIEGKLYFPPEASVTIKTKFVWVLGLLKMDTPAVDNLVKFHMVGDDLQTYTSSGMGPCSAMNGGCNQGSKVIAVHGGQLDIQGIESTCPSWEKLTNVGEGSLRPFDLPCDGGSCWDSDVMELTGNCAHSQGHSDKIGKYTVHCPLKNKAAHIGSGSSKGIKLTSVGQGPFVYPEDSTQTLSLELNGNCGRAGHTDSLGKCTVYCPIKPTAVIGSGFGGALTFKSVKAEPEPYVMPDPNLALRIKSTCHNKQSHTDAWGRCVIRCPLYPTVNYGSGSAGWSPFQLNSVYGVPDPFVKSNPDYRAVVAGPAVHMQGHTDAWNTCVFRVTIEPTVGVSASHFELYHTNLETGQNFRTSRVINWSAGGVHLYMHVNQYDKATECLQAVDDFNAIFPVGSEVTSGYAPIPTADADGSTFSIDRVMHWAHGASNMYFFPSNKDTATCGATAEEFQAKFPPGYSIVPSYPSAAAPGDEEFEVNGVHHWAWNGNTMYFFPSASDPATCSQTAADFNAKFPQNFGIDVSLPAPAGGFGQTVTASKGVHHWSWNKNGLFFFPDETAAEINAKFGSGIQLQVEYTDTLNFNDVQVSPEAADCWKPGTEVLLTSHTRYQADQQVRTIASTDPATGTMTFTEPIEKPISLADHPDFAVEIASLNRRIVFEADDDVDDEFIGGHLVVHHTTSPQHIEGVEIKNFGQQGRLGKYPLHFHMCGDSPGSVVKKNVVRESNQRCYVVHLTNQLLLEENVAYDTFGHCYFIEDGAEVENTFTRNLGSGIKIMPTDRVAQLEAKSGRDETDDQPHGFNGASVFWISNPQNHFIGNVAAGGQTNGYWFETRGPRMYMNLGTFRDNEVHSAQAMAFTTYAPGWRPSETAIIENLKVYRNAADGAFLHVTRNLIFRGGLFADNAQKHIFTSRGDNVIFDGTHFIGQSEFSSKNCGSSKIGIQLDPYKLHETHRGAVGYRGTTVRNATFENFSLEDTGCSSYSAPIKFADHQTFLEAYQAPHTIENIQVDSPFTLDACMPGSGIDDVVVEIASDNYGAFPGVGSLVNPKFQPFVPGCQAYNECLVFCPNACLRTVSVLAGDASFDEDIVMIVSDGSGNEVSITRDVSGYPEPNPIGNRDKDAYTTVLPKGNFTIRFESISSPGTQVWPGFVTPIFEDPPLSCTDYIEASDLTISKPLGDRPACDSLIYNGDFDSGLWGIEGWLRLHCSGDSFASSAGVDGTGALSSVQSCNPMQYLDTSCLVEGAEYDIEVSFKIVDGAGAEITDATAFPSVRLTTTGDQTRHTTLASATSYTGGWGTMSGTFTVGAILADPATAQFRIYGGPDSLVIDNVSMIKSSVVAPTSAPARRLRTAK